MSRPSLTIDLVRHMKAKDRSKWTQDQDERPLTRLGRQQADVHAAAMAEGEKIVAIYASPALRCRETIAPLADLLSLETIIEPSLRETGGYASPAGWDGFDYGPGGHGDNPIGPAMAAGQGLAAIERLRSRHRDGGRIVACSHGDTIPMMVTSLAAFAGTPLPPPLWGFGGWYRLRFEEAKVSIERFEPPPGFPIEK
ncbi:MAG TPA: histidine phosphatase family protein [Dehalococcoidia bacterium]|nr:histidine phosphatase family protein [Dehalococcoidia bacterium]